MKLTRLSYKDANWELNDLDFDQLNLIVAKNATGKTKTLSTIDLLVKIITQKIDLNRGYHFRVAFQDHSYNLLNYEFTTGDATDFLVVSERMTLNDELVLERGDSGAASVKNELTNRMEEIFPPFNKLVLHTNRDVKKYPFLEHIVSWAEHSFGFKFGNISPAQRLSKEFDLVTGADDIPALFLILPEQSRKKVIDDFNATGYRLSAIEAIDTNNIVTLLAYENGIEQPVPHFRLSQGMYRDLSIVIYLEYLVSRQKPYLVIIDDLCEGLDYERAQKLGRLVFDKCRNANIQLVATSNDSFLMEVVDIKYWNILVRKGKTVSGLNVQNSPKVFQDFRFTGLSNFDFFSSDFVKQQI